MNQIGLKRLLCDVLLLLSFTLGGTGCRLALFGGALAVGTAGLAGYTVYKGGQYTVATAGKAVGAGADAVSGGAQKVSEVVFFRGEFRTVCSGSVEQVWRTASNVLPQLGFRNTRGDFDALSGEVKALTRDGQNIEVKLKSITPSTTELRIRVGVRGDLKASEMIYDRIVADLNNRLGTANASKITEERI